MSCPTRRTSLFALLLSLILGGCVGPQPQWSVDYAAGCPLDVAVNQYSEGCASWHNRHPAPGVEIAVQPRAYAQSLFAIERDVPAAEPGETLPAQDYESGDERAVRRWYLRSPEAEAVRLAMRDWPNFSDLGFK